MYKQPKDIRSSSYSRNTSNHNIPITQEQLTNLLTLNTSRNNLYQYLHQTSQFNIDFSGSPLRILLKARAYQGDMFQFYYLHQAERKYILLNFLYSFLKSKDNQPYEIMLIQGPGKLTASQISVYLHETSHKEKYGKPPVSYVHRPTNEWLCRIRNVSVTNKEQLKLAALMLPITLENNRKIKAIICADINMFDLDYRAKINEKVSKMLLDTGLVVLSFKKDYHPINEPIYVEVQGEGTKQCIGKITKLVSESKNHFFVKYLAPAEFFRAATYHKEDVFRSVMVSSIVDNSEKLKVTVFSPYPFELHEEIVNKGSVEEGQNYFKKKSGRKPLKQQQ